MKIKNALGVAAYLQQQPCTAACGNSDKQCYDNATTAKTAAVNPVVRNSYRWDKNSRIG